MHYSNENLSILKAVTKSTLNTSTPPAHDLSSSPSPVAPMFDLNDSDNDEYSYAIISTGEIDLAAIKKEKAKTQKSKRLIEDQGMENSKAKDDVSMEERGDIITVESREILSYCYLLLLVVLAICFMFGVLTVMEDGDGRNRISSAINDTKDFTTRTLKVGHELLWHWHDYIDKVRWDQSKTWLHQEKAVLNMRLLALPPYLAKQSQKWLQQCADYSSGWMEETVQSVTVFLDRYLFFGNTSWIMVGKS